MLGVVEVRNHVCTHSAGKQATFGERLRFALPLICVIGMKLSFSSVSENIQIYLAFPL